jgi:hypothetical protein
MIITTHKVVGMEKKKKAANERNLCQGGLNGFLQLGI